MRRLILLSLFTLSTLVLTGCPRYETVRKLSSEQLRVQEAFQDTLTKYFSSIEQFANNQVIVDKLYYDDLAAADESRIRRKARRDLSAIPAESTAARETRSEQLGSDLQVMHANTDKDKEDLDNAVQGLKAKHKEILDTYQAILDAQRQLNEYIQLKKADEVIVEQLLGKIKFNEQKITRLFDEAAKISDKIRVKIPQPVAIN